MMAASEAGTSVRLVIRLCSVLPSPVGTALSEVSEDASLVVATQASVLPCWLPVR